ncbi:MAG: hypothetical protein J6M15_00330 [Prevotella sp.]|nr:hypothetical protein [Prevotella sp.]MBP3827671.1 hypothetical protein [Prevotella sp.]
MMRLLFLMLLLTCPSLLTARETDDRYIVERCMQSLADFTRYATSIYVDAGVNDAGKPVGYFKATDAGKSNEDGVRTNLDIVMVCAFVGTFFTEGVAYPQPSLPKGVTAEGLRRMALASLRYGYSTHHTVRLKKCTDGKYWGTYQDGNRKWHHQWESSLWVLSMAFAEKFLATDSEDSQSIQKVVESEADYQLSRPVPHGFKGDTKAEENGWEANVLAVAWSKYPAHPHAGQWREAMIRYGLNGYTVDADARDTTMLDGKRVCEWYAGTNLFPDYTLQNHHYFHTSYQNVVMQEQAESILATYYLNECKNTYLYRSLTWHWQEVWEQVLAQLALADGELAMPNGNDWSMFLYDQLPAYAAMATIMRNGDALMLERKCLDQLLARQKTTGDGRYLLNADIGARRMGVTAHRVMMTMLLHRLFPTDHLQVTEWKDFQQRHAVARVFPSQHLVRAMTKERFTCLSWSEGLKNFTGCIVPNRVEDSKIMIPYKKGFGGNLIGEPKSFPEKPVVKTDGNAWTVSGRIDGEPFVIWSTPGNAVIVMNRPAYMALSYDPFTKEEREIREGDQWVNIDNSVAVVGNHRYGIGEKKVINSIGTRVLTGEGKATVYFSGVSAAESARLAKKTKIKEKGHLLILKTQDPDGTRYTMTLNRVTGEYTHQ